MSWYLVILANGLSLVGVISILTWLNLLEILNWNTYIIMSKLLLMAARHTLKDAHTAWIVLSCYLRRGDVWKLEETQLALVLGRSIKGGKHLCLFSCDQGTPADHTSLGFYRSLVFVVDYNRAVF